jgi:hypothetical protein
MADRLGDRLVVVTDSGMHGNYGSNACATKIEEEYLIAGSLPAPGATCPGLPRPDVPADAAGTAGNPRADGAQSLESAARTVVRQHRNPWSR